MTAAIIYEELKPTSVAMFSKILFLIYILFIVHDKVNVSVLSLALCTTCGNNKNYERSCSLPYLKLLRGGANRIDDGNHMGVSRVFKNFKNSVKLNINSRESRVHATLINNDDIKAVDNIIPVMPCNDALDKTIGQLALPAILNFAIIPLVGAADTFWVGKMRDAQCLAGQGASNQVFSSIFWIISFLPSIVTPLVAKAAGANNREEIQDRVGEAIFLALVMGVVGMGFLNVFRDLCLSSVLKPESAARIHAEPYLFIRSLTFVPTILSTVSFAVFRGMFDIVTPLKIAAISNIINVLLDPFLIFNAGMGVAGAAAATCVAELSSFLLYARQLIKKNLINRQNLFRIPSIEALKPLFLGGI